MREFPAKFTVLFLAGILCSLFLFGQSDEKEIIRLTKDSLDQTSESEKQINFQNKLSFYYRYQNQDSSRFYGEKAMSLARQTGDSAKLGTALHNLAVLAYRHARFEEAFARVNEALEIANRIKKPGLQSICYNDLGILQLRVGDYKKALASFLKVLELQKELNQVNVIGPTTLNVGIVFENLLEYDKAMKHYNEALELATNASDTTRIIQCMNNIGVIYDKTKNLDSALYYYQSCLVLAQKYRRSNDYLKSALLHNIGSLHIQNGDLERANLNLNMALKLALEKNYKVLLGSIYATSADMYLMREDVESAIHFAKIGLQISKETEALTTGEETSKTLQKAYQKIGNYDSAYAYLVMHDGYKDSLLSKRQDAEIKRLTIEHEIAQKERELAFQRSLFEEKSKQNQILMFALFFLGGLTVLLAYLGIRLRHAKRIVDQKSHFIENQRNQLAELNQFKDRIFSIMAHDIRGPLSNISGLMDILMEGPIDDYDRKKLASKIKKQVKETFSIFDNLLLWSKNRLLEERPPKAFNLTELVKDSIQAASMESQKKEIHIESTLPREIWAYADEGMIQTVVRNLMSNAIKFTPQGGKIELHAKLDHQYAYLSVEDSGVGVPEDKIHRIFDLRQNMSTPGTEDERGTGLGLPLSREFIELNGGKIWVEGKADEGSIFTISIPLAKVPTMG